MQHDINAPLALHGGSPIRDAGKSWPAWPIFDEREEKALLGVLHSRKWFYNEQVAAFEAEYAAFHDAKFAVSCNSGATALELILQVLNIGPGDEVLVPPYTFIATAGAVMRVGATPVFVDLDHSWCMSPELTEAAITPKTKAIMPVHFGGRVCDMDAMKAIAEKHNLYLLEDACHSWGSQWRGKGTGALGLCGVFSFQESKNISSGEGGIVLTDDENFADQCRSVSNCGRDKDGPWYYHVNVGTNIRLTEFQAAILRVQLTRLEAQTLLRQKNAAVLNEAFSEIEGLTLQSHSEHITRRAYHLYCFQIDAQRFGCNRESFIAAAAAEGLTVSAGYPYALYEQPAIQKFYAAQGRALPSCPVTEDICHTSGLWLLHPSLLGSEEDTRDIVAIVQKIKANASKLA